MSLNYLSSYMCRKIKFKFLVFDTVVFLIFFLSVWLLKLFPFCPQIRMASRHIGCVGIFLLFSSIFENLPSKQLQKLGETVIGLFLMAFVYILNDSVEDKNAFLYHVPGGDWSRYFFTLVLAAGAISFFSGHFLRDMSISVIVMFGILTILVDCDINYWVEGNRMLFWNQVRIIIDDLCILLGFAMIVVRIDNRVKVEWLGNQRT